MKTHTSRIVVLFFAVLLVALPAAAQETPTYTAENNAFTVTLPTGWTTENIPDGVEFNSPDGVSLYWIALPAVDTASGAEAAIEIFTPDFAGAAVQTTDLPTPRGLWTQTIYTVSDLLAASLTLFVNDTAYVLWLPPMTQSDLVAVSPALNEMLLSFQYAGGRDVSDADVFTFEQDAADLLDGYIESALTTFEIPGAAVAVVQNGVVVFTGAYGLANVEDAMPVTEATRFMIGSSTKSMTSWGAAVLVDEGAFTWETPISDILPEFSLSDPEQAAALTVRDFFGMASGLPRYDASMILERRTPDELLAEIATIPLTAAPGEQFGYNNQMVALGGFATAAYAAGVPLSEGAAAYDALLLRAIFDPLGMTATTVNFDTALATGEAATSYYYDAFESAYLPVPVDYERFVVPVAPAGAVWSTAGDMGLYLAAHMRDGAAGDGTPIVSADNLAVTKTGVVSIAGAGEYALGWFIGDWNGTPMLEHGGATSGFSTVMSYLPDVDFGVVVLTNRSGGDNFGNAVRDYAFELAFNLPNESEARYVAAADGFASMVENLTEGVQITRDPVDAEAVAPFLGQYDLDVTVSLDGAGMLTIAGDFPPITLYMSGAQANTYVTSGVLGGLVLVFSETADGAQIAMFNPFGEGGLTTAELTLNKVGE
jgi:CubicO group peptidase (beta-lactamase class C family)